MADDDKDDFLILKEAAEKAGGVVESKAAATAAKVDSKVAATAAKIAPSDGNLQQWAKWLADQLRRVQDIKVYDALRLADLETRGPAPARAVWATAKDVLAKDYGKVTVGDLLKQFGA